MPDQDESNGQESGGEFRAKFAATQAENTALRNQVAQALGVPADELKGVPPDQFSTKAEEYKKAQAAQEDAILRKRLGLPEDADLDAALTNLGVQGSEDPAPKQESGPNPFASTGQLGGRPVGSNPTEGLRGRDRIKASLRASKN